MINRNPVLLPTSEMDWELWGNARLKRVDDPAALNGQPLHFALPLDFCRSFPLRLPTKDKKLFRDLIYSQLEKRHLVSPTSNARFDFEPLDRSAEGTLVRVDLVNRDLPQRWEDKKALSYAASLRYYSYPLDHAVVLRERGRLCLVLNRGGKLLYSTILNQSGQLNASVPSEIQSAALSLQSKGLLESPLKGVEVWGAFPPEDVEAMRARMSIPVTVREHPSPEGMRKPINGALLPPSVDIDAKKRRKLLGMLLVLAIVVAGYLAVLKHFRDKLVRLEAQIEAQQEDLGENSANSATYAASEARWKAMANAIDPLRYPLLQFNKIAEVMPPDGVILSRYETKITEVRLRGHANNAKGVFDFLDNLNAHPELGAVHRWSRKREPSLDDDGTANFEIIGKLR